MSSTETNAGNGIKILRMDVGGNYEVVLMDVGDVFEHTSPYTILIRVRDDVAVGQLLPGDIGLTRDQMQYLLGRKNEIKQVLVNVTCEQDIRQKQRDAADVDALVVFWKFFIAPKVSVRPRTPADDLADTLPEIGSCDSRIAAANAILDRLQEGPGEMPPLPTSVRDLRYCD